jgi:hypothetical protein
MRWATTTGACALAAVAAGSLASEPILADDAGGVMADRVQIELRGSIAPQCAFQDIAAGLDLGPFQHTGEAGQKRLDFRISCNAPFAYSLSSEQGAMRRESGAAGASGLLTELPYQVALNILTDDGGSLMKTCASGELGAPGGGCQGQSGDKTAIDKDASLTVSWGPSAGPLAAGRYLSNLNVVLSIAN